MPRTSAIVDPSDPSAREEHIAMGKRCTVGRKFKASSEDFEGGVGKKSKLEKMQIRQNNRLKEKAIQPQPKSQPGTIIIVPPEKQEAVHQHSMKGKTIAGYRKKGQKANDKKRDDQREFKQHQQALV